MERVAAIVDAFNRRDVDAIMGYRADDVVWAMARGPRPRGRKYEGAEAVHEALVARFESIPDARWDDVGVSEWTLTGTASKGEKLELLGCDLWNFRDGKVVRKDTCRKQIDREFT